MDILEKHKIIILNSELESELYYNEAGEHLRYDKKCTHLPWVNKYKHLYILSDEQIKKGDYYALLPEGQIKRSENNLPIHKDWKKIIASSDKLITPNAWIPDSFIHKYVDDYNSFKEIEEVELKLSESTKHNMPSTYDKFPYKTKSDGSIIMVKIKNDWTEDELLKVLSSYQSNCEMNYDTGRVPNAKEWFIRNFKH